MTREKRIGKIKLCDGECNKCPLVNYPNNMMLSFILNKLHNTFGDKVYDIVQKNCPNLTVCNECKIDDFCHVENCKILKTKLK